MTSHLTKRFARRLAGITAMAALTIGVGAATAAAAEINVTPSSGLSATEASVLSVTGSGFAASQKVSVGLCSAEKYGLLGIPACGEMVEATANGSGQISTSVEVEKTTFNVHYNLPPLIKIGQPETFTCAGEVGVDDDCEIWAVNHNESKEVFDKVSVSFK